PRVPKPKAVIAAVTGQKVARMVKGHGTGGCLKDMAHSALRHIPNINLIFGAIRRKEHEGARNESPIAAPVKMKDWNRQCKLIDQCPGFHIADLHGGAIGAAPTLSKPVQDLRTEDR